MLYVTNDLNKYYEEVKKLLDPNNSGNIPLHVFSKFIANQSIFATIIQIQASQNNKTPKEIADSYVEFIHYNNNEDSKKYVIKPKFVYSSKVSEKKTASQATVPKASTYSHPKLPNVGLPSFNGYQYTAAPYCSNLPFQSAPYLGSPLQAFPYYGFPYSGLPLLDVSFPQALPISGQQLANMPSIPLANFSYPIVSLAAALVTSVQYVPVATVIPVLIPALILPIKPLPSLALTAISFVSLIM